MIANALLVCLGTRCAEARPIVDNSGEGDVDGFKRAIGLLGDGERIVRGEDASTCRGFNGDRGRGGIGLGARFEAAIRTFATLLI